MMLSKVCSDQNKPNGQYFLPANVDDIMRFVQKLPIRKVPEPPCFCWITFDVFEWQMPVPWLIFNLL